MCSWTLNAVAIVADRRPGAGAGLLGTPRQGRQRTRPAAPFPLQTCAGNGGEAGPCPGAPLNNAPAFASADPLPESAGQETCHG